MSTTVYCCSPSVLTKRWTMAESELGGLYESKIRSYKKVVVDSETRITGISLHRFVQEGGHFDQKMSIRLKVGLLRLARCHT
jgi:hypothetical protein